MSGRSLACPVDAFIAAAGKRAAGVDCHLRFPHEHWTRIRHVNLIDRTFGETAAG